MKKSLKKVAKVIFIFKPNIDYAQAVHAAV